MFTNLTAQIIRVLECFGTDQLHLVSCVAKEVWLGWSETWVILGVNAT